MKKSYKEGKEVGERSYRLEPIYCKGMVVSVNRNSIMFFDETHESLYSAPFSKITNWRYLGGRPAQGFELWELQENDLIELHLPWYLLDKEGCF